MEEHSRLALRLGIDDVFALRRVYDDQIISLAGIGRGEAWAGNISIDPLREPLISQALSSPRLIRYEGEVSRIFGPYWNEHAAVLMVGGVVVVLGGPGVAAHDDATLIEAAGDFAWSAKEVSPEKRLSDELEVTKAALAVGSLPTGDIDAFLHGVAAVATDALAVEFGAAVLRAPDSRLVVDIGRRRPGVSAESLRDYLLYRISGMGIDRPIVEQDLRISATTTSPLGFEHGFVSRCIIPIHGPDLSAAVVAAHTVDAPRGFTLLCRQVAAKIGEQAARVLRHDAAVRVPNHAATA